MGKETYGRRGSDGENQKHLKLTLPVIGAFIALALSINVYFIKNIVSSLNSVQVDTAILLDRSNFIKNDLEKIKVRLLKLEQK